MRKFSAVVLVMVAVSLGCLRPMTMTINLPHGYSGRVTVPCSGVNEGELSLDVSASGNVPVTKCPTALRDILIRRDGRILSPNNLVMNRTGDGIVTSIEFNAE